MGNEIAVYPDTCFYGRPFDLPPTPKILAEVKAIDTILKKRGPGKLRIIGSAAISFEIEQITDTAERKKIDAYYRKFITETAAPRAQTKKRVAALVAAGLGNMDATHLAIAEDAGADFLLTVDKAFIKKCNILNLTTVKVMNPLDFVKGGYLK